MSPISEDIDFYQNYKAGEGEYLLKIACSDGSEEPDEKFADKNDAFNAAKKFVVDLVDQEEFSNADIAYDKEAHRISVKTNSLEYHADVVQA